MDRARMKRTHPGVEIGRKRASRPVSRVMMNARKQMEEHHLNLKWQGVRLWELLGNPVYDASMGPGSGYSAEAIAVAKRGRRCTIETAWIGRNATMKEIRDRERSAKKKGLRTRNLIGCWSTRNLWRTIRGPYDVCEQRRREGPSQEGCLEALEDEVV